MELGHAETVTIRQAGDLLRQAAELYFQKDGQGRYLMDRRRARPICLMGPPGIGKTEVVGQVARELDLALLSYSLTHHTRQSLLGLPLLREAQVDGKPVTVTEYTMSEIVAAIWKTMDETGKREGILFLDEFNCASPTLQPILLQLLQAKRFGAFDLPEGWLLVVAGNPGEYNASANTLDAVTADRLRMLWLRADYPVWRDYMSAKGAHPAVLAYLDTHGDHFCLFSKEKTVALVTPRAWEDLSVMLTANEEAGFPVDLAFVGQYLQSAQVAREFAAFYAKCGQAVVQSAAHRLLAGEGVDDLWPQLQALPRQEKWAFTAHLLSQLRQLCRAARETEEWVAPLHALLKAALAGGDPIDGLHRVEEDDPFLNQRGADFIRDYLAGTVRDRDGRALRLAFRSGPLAELNVSMARAEIAIDTCAAFCRDCFAGEPQLEFLMNGLTQDFDCQWVAAQRQMPDFRQAGRELYLGTPELSPEQIAG